VRDDPLRLRPGIGQETRRPCVPATSLERCDCLVNRRADQWVDEPQRRLRAQHVHPRERAGRLGGGALVQVGQPRRLPGIGIVAQDRDRPRERRRRRRKPGEAKRDGARAGPRRELAQASHVRPGRGQALRGDDKHELAQEQRIAARRFLAGGAEGILSLGREALAQKPDNRRGAQRSRADACGERIGDDLPDQARIRSRFRRPEADDDQKAEPLHPRQQIGQPAQRGQIAPVQVVDRQQERPARGEVRRQPIQTMQRRQRRVPSRLDRDLGGLKERRRQRSRALEQLRSLVDQQRGDQRLEQLAHHPVRERALELGAARAEHLPSGLLSHRPRLRKQRGLADTGRTLDRQQPTTVADRVDQATHRRKLGVALEQDELNREWLLGHLRAAPIVTDVRQRGVRRHRRLPCMRGSGPRRVRSLGGHRDRRRRPDRRVPPARTGSGVPHQPRQLRRDAGSSRHAV